MTTDSKSMEQKDGKFNFEEFFSNIPNDVLWKLSSSLRGKTIFSTSPKIINVSLAILYLRKHNKLSIINTVPEDKKTIVSLVTPELLAVTKTSEAMKNKIYCVVSSLEKDDEFYEIVDENISILREEADATLALDALTTLIEKEWKQEDYEYAVSFLVDDLREKQESRDFSTPKEVRTLMTSLLNKDSKTIYDPCAGAYTFALEMSRDKDFYGCETSPRIYETSQLIFALLDIDSKHLRNGDFTTCGPKTKVDSIISELPMGTKTSQNETIAQYLFKNFEEMTTETGQMIVLTSCLELYAGGKAKEARKNLVEQNLIDKVFFLPGNVLMGTSVPSVIFVMQKNLKPDHKIELINLENTYSLRYGKRKYICAEEALSLMDSTYSEDVLLIDSDAIRTNDYNLAFSVYQAINENNEIPDGYEARKIGDFLKSVSSPCRNEGKEVKYVDVSQLSSRWSDYELKIDDIPLRIPFPKNLRILKTPALLISKIRSLKPTYCNASEDNPVYLSENVYAFKVTKDMHLGYLCYELSRAEMPFVGATIPMLSKISFLQLRIPMAPVSMQAQIYAEARNVEAHSVLKEYGLEKEIEKIKQDYNNNIRSWRHNMKPLMSNMYNSVLLLKKRSSKFTNLQDLQNEVKNTFEAFLAKYNMLYDMLDALSIEGTFGKKEDVNLRTFLEEIKDMYKDAETFDLDFLFDEMSIDKNYEPLSVLISRNDLKRVALNIIENAKKHGFVDESMKYAIRISVSMENQDNGAFAVINFQNDGKAFPENFDAERYGISGEKAGDTAGTGIGGYEVASIVQHFGGRYEIDGEEGNVNVRIYLPIKEQKYGLQV